MTFDPMLFHQTPESLRRIGARGGRACARNWRARQRLATTAAPVTVRPMVARQTTAQTIATLDAQFSWLRRAERRAARR